MRILLSTFAFLVVFSVCRCSPRYAKDNDDYPPDKHVHEREYPPSKGMTAKGYPRDSARLADNGYYPPDQYMSEKGYPQNDLITLEDVLRAYGLSNEGYLPEDSIDEKEYNTPDPPEPVPSTKEAVPVRNVELASDVADEYMEQLEADNRREKKNKSGSSSEALRSFNAPSDKTKRMDATATRGLAELETLALLTSTDEQFVRELQEAGLFDRAVTDPTCNLKVDCHDTMNLNMKNGTEYRNINGTCNNKDHFQWGMAGVQHKRLLPNAYNNKRWVIRKVSAGKGQLPPPRSISNVVHATTGDKQDNDNNLAIALFYFMQFIDHDLAKTPEGHVESDIDCCSEKKQNKAAMQFCMPIRVLSTGDDHFEQGYCMDARRSDTVRMCEDKKVRNQINEITSYMDASMVYGSSDEEMQNLRTFNEGLLKESTKEFMPASATPGDLPCNVTQPSDPCFEAGDTRANVHPGLTTYHTVFVREHNRIVDELSAVQKDWGDEKLFQEGRKIIIAMIQHIAYTAVLPKLFSESKLQEYGVSTDYTYDPEVDVSMTQAFSMAFRYHHLMPDELHIAKFVGSDRKVKNYGNIRQELAYFRPHYLTDKNYRGINEVALGMVQSSCPYVDGQVNSAARNSLFLDKDGDSFDLAALNIMRGREWGMRSYTEYREFCGLKKVTTWDDLNDVMDEAVINNMAKVYKDVRDIDLWTGVVSEKPVSGSISGETQTCLLAKHFANIKHGDRFWYEADFTQKQLDEIKKTTLARIFCSNLKVEKMREDVFDKESLWRSCVEINEESDLEFSEWNVIE